MPDRALGGYQRLSGEILLADGCHRWAVADALGVPMAPVRMTYEAPLAGEA